MPVQEKVDFKTHVKTKVIPIYPSKPKRLDGFRTTKFAIKPPKRTKTEIFHDNIEEMLETLRVRRSKKIRFLAPKIVERPKGLPTKTLVILLIVFGLLATSLLIRTIFLKNEIDDILVEYQAVQKNSQELAEKHENLKSAVGDGGTRAAELEEVNKFLLERVAEQERDLNDLSYVVTEQVLDLQREMQAEQEKLLAEQGELLEKRYLEKLETKKPRRKAFREFFYESYTPEQ